jgi:branched-chain amino acid transport system permease protein
MEFFGIALIEGIVLGSIYAIMALGFVLIFKSTKIINFAQGELMMVGAFVIYLFAVQLGLNLGISFILTFLITALLGVIINFALFKNMIGESPFSLVMVTVGLSYLLKCGTQLIWGAETKAIPSIISGPNIKLASIPIARDSLATVIFALIFLTLFHLFFKYTKKGIAMRATANDQLASMACGVEVNTIFAAAWAISFMLSSVGGAIMARTYGLNSNLGIIGLRVFPVIILGGLDSIGGAIVGGYIIGLLESFTRAYIGQYFSTSLEIIPFIVLLVILLIKPYGLFGSEKIERL